MGKWIAIALMACALMLTGCNTWHGFGKDMEKAGEKIQRSPNN